MPVYKKLLFVLLLSISATSKAIEPNAAGNLAIIIAVADSPKYLKTWISTPPEEAAPIPRLKELVPDQVGYAGFIITGIAGDELKNYSYSVSWKLIAPSGETLFTYPNYAKGSGKLHHRDSFYLANPALDIVLENSDPSGEYTLEATVIDQNGGKNASSLYKIQFRKQSKPKP
jgi:hypothetical protein